MKTFETVTVVWPQDHTVLVTLNRPEVANAMNTQMGLDLLEIFDGFCAAPNKQRCIVLTGAGATGVLCRGRSEAARRHDRRDVAGSAFDL